MNLKGIMKSLGVKPGQVVSDPYARAFAPQITEAEGNDHEVSMAKGSLEAIVKHANELMGKLGNNEKDIPGWIQDHIAKSENFIQQANDQYHEYGKNESLNEDVSDSELINNLELTNQNLLKKLRSSKDSKEKSYINSLIKTNMEWIKFWKDRIKFFGKKESVNEVAGDTYVVYIMDGIGKKKVKETAGKTNAIRLANRLMTNPKIEGAGWMSAEAWQREPFRVA